MSDGISLLTAALLGLLVGVWGTIAFFTSERARRREIVAPESTEDQVAASPVLDALPQSHIIVDREGVVLRASTRAYSYGIVYEGAIVRDELLRVVEATRADGLIHVEEVRMSRSMLEERMVSRLIVRSAPMSGGRVLVLFEDNTARLRLEETRRDFTANVSHELKTPIGAISLLAETISESSHDAEAVQHFSGLLAKESIRLGQLVQEIIELSRLQEGDAFSTSDLVMIDDVVAEAVDRTRVTAADRGVALVSGGVKGLVVYGDKVMLTTAVRNLLDNAVRYSRPRGRVSVGVSQHDGLVSIAVVDQGEGIAPEARERVFERFYRGDKARSRETGGSGLGLSIVKHVIADHGGRVNLWSEAGKGSTFTVLLPEAHVPSGNQQSLASTQLKKQEGPVISSGASPSSAMGAGSRNQPTTD